jgi:hypothetical protein
MKIKKTIFFLLAFIFSMGYSFGQGGPPPPPDGVIDNPVPIDGELWLGILLALVLGGYIIYIRRTSTQK